MTQLTAAFRLEITSGPTTALDRLEEMLARIEQRLGMLGRATDPFDKLWEPVDRAAGATNLLGENLTRTASEATRTGEALTVLGNEATGSLDRAAAAAGRLGEAVETVSAVGARIPGVAPSIVPAVAPGEAPEEELPVPGRRGSLRAVGGALHNFGNSIQEGVGSAFGAAATGFGLIAPIHAAAEYDNTIRHIGIGLDLHGAANDAFTANYSRQLDALARQTGQRSADLAEAAGFFSREGYSGARLNAVMPTVGHIATAYNAAPEAVAKSTFALQESMHIDNRSLGGALASVALAGKQADLPFEKLAPLLPQVAAQAGALGVTGRAGVDDLAAALAVVRKTTGTEGEAVTNTRAFLQTITSPHTAERFAKFGVDLFGVEANARKQGLDPMEAVLHQVDRITRRGADTKALGTLFNNQEDRAFAQALLTHIDQYFAIHDKVSKADPAMLQEDFNTGITTLKIRVQSFDEALTQLERRVGVDFAPIMNRLTGGLHGVINTFDWLDKHVPGATTAVIGVAGGFLVLATAMGAVGAVAIPLRAGFGLLKTTAEVTRLTTALRLVPLGLEAVGVAGIAAVAEFAIVAVALGAVAYGIYHNWDRIKGEFQTFEHWVSGWGERISGTISHAFTALDTKFPASPTARGALVVQTTGHGWSPSAQQTAHVHITTDQGLKAEVRKQGGNARVTTGVDRGRMLNRP